MLADRARSCSLIVAALVWLPLTGCDPPNRGPDAAGDSPVAATPSAQPSPAPAQPPSQIQVVVRVTPGGAITCTSDGQPILPLRRDEILGRSEDPRATALLIVRDSSIDRESYFDVSLDLDSADVRTHGRATVHHLRRNVIVETDGPAAVRFTVRSTRDDADDCGEYAASGQLERLASRLKADPSLIDAPGSRDGRTPLARAAAEGQVETAAYLLDLKANIEVKDDRGYTPLHIAVINRKPEMVKLLIARAANLNAVTPRGNTAMHLAIDRKYPEIASLLADSGADANVVNRSGQTPMQAAIDRIFELSRARNYGPFVDGTSIRYDGDRLYIIGAGETDESRWKQFDLPGTHETWIALTGTNYAVYVRGHGAYRVWARYRGEDPTVSQ